MPIAREVVPLAKARSRLTEIIDLARDDKVWVITKDGQPRVALIDIAYLDRLLASEQAQWYELAQASLARVWEHPDEDVYTANDGEPL